MQSEMISLTVFVLAASACAAYLYRNVFGTDD